MKPRLLLSRFVRRLFIVLATAVIAVTGWYFLPQDLVKPQFTVSKETTFYTGPIDLDGYVDYLNALNEKMQQGATTENNAMILLMQAIGPKIGKETFPPEYYRRLGMSEPPLDGSSYISLTELASEKVWPEFNQMETINDWYNTVTSRPWNKKQYSRVAEWIERNAVPLEFIEKASRRTHYYSPMVFSVTAKLHQKTLMGALLPCIQRCREMANLIMARSYAED